MQPFHLAIPVHDLDAARTFYGSVLKCPEGRSSDCWIDFNLYGHQLVAHHVPQSQATQDPTNSVDDHAVPVPHFGVVLEWEAWEALAERMRAHETKFILEPYVRFEGLPGEQATMFFRDPSGNALEFKAFRNAEALFATDMQDVT